MDPVGPWSAYASYNRLAGVQASATSGDFHHHLTSGGTGLAHNPASGVPSTTSQLLLQAHTTASLAGQLGSSTASPFNPGTFLSPPPVGYDAMFSPLFHHGNPKPAHYSSAQHRQALAQAAAVSKQATVESEISTLRETYSQHHQNLAAAQGSGFFDQSNAPAGSTLAWQGNNQLPSPFGILPHESVVPSSPGPPTTKSSASSSSAAVYENSFAHFAAAQSHINNQINSQIVAATSSKSVRSASPQVSTPVKPVASQASSNSAGGFFQSPSTFGGADSGLSNYSSTGSKQQQLSSTQQQEYAANVGPVGSVNTGKNTRNAGANATTHQTGSASGATTGAAANVIQVEAAKPPEKKVAVPPGTAGSGFMASYLKFLQGERDTSPPPATRGGRKATWSRTTATTTSTSVNSSTSTNSNVNNKPFAHPDAVTKPVDQTNGVPQQNSVTTPSPIVSASAGKTDLQDDPRYFPLPKDRKRKGFDSSDDGFDTSDDDGLGRGRNKPVLNVPSTPLGDKGKKGRPPLNKPQPVSQVAPAAVPKKPRPPQQPQTQPQHPAMMQQHYYQQPAEEVADPLQLPPRRETSRRKAKERNNIAQLIDKQASGDIDEPEEPPEFVDSDSDPAWTPQATKDGDEDGLLPVQGGPKKKKRGRTVQSGRNRRGQKSNILSAAAQGAGIDYGDYSSDDEMMAIGGTKRQVSAPVGQTTSENNLTVPSTSNPDHMHFKAEEFVVVRAELSQEWPTLWRVDGKALLQKYEPFDQNGRTLYRNISTYAAWTTESRRMYISAPVRIRSQTHTETIVEFLRQDLVLEPPNTVPTIPTVPLPQMPDPQSNNTMTDEFTERSLAASMAYQDHFEVYIQTLISQALDSNFLTEIFQEQDEYFLANVKTVDDITDDRRRRLLAVTRMPRNLEVSICTWPCFNVMTEHNTSGAACTVCQQPSKLISARVILYGQPYNCMTLEGCPPDPSIPVEKNFLMCRDCSTRVALLNKIAHQKYLMFIECAKRVSEKRSQDPMKDTTVILNELLADEPWLSQLFKDVRTSWAEVENVEQQWRMINRVAI